MYKTDERVKAWDLKFPLLNHATSCAQYLVLHTYESLISPPLLYMLRWDRANSYLHGAAFRTQLAHHGISLPPRFSSALPLNLCSCIMTVSAIGVNELSKDQCFLCHWVHGMNLKGCLYFIAKGILKFSLSKWRLPQKLPFMYCPSLMVRLLFWRYVCSYLAISMAQSIIRDRLLYFCHSFWRVYRKLPLPFWRVAKFWRECEGLDPK